MSSMRIALAAPAGHGAVAREPRTCDQTCSPRLAVPC